MKKSWNADAFQPGDPGHSQAAVMIHITVLIYCLRLFYDTGMMLKLWFHV